MMTVVVKKVGGSVAVVIPKAIASEMGLTDGTSMDLTTSADAIVMRKRGRRPRRALDHIVSQIKSSGYRRRRREFPEELPLGKEIW